MSIFSIVDQQAARELWEHRGCELTIRKDPGGVYVDCDTHGEILIGFEEQDG